MWRNLIYKRSCLALALLFLITGGTAQATTNYGDFAAGTVTYEQVTETSSFGDPEPLFGAPTVVGDQLQFFPATFEANAAGASGFDQTGALLQTTITTNDPLGFLDTFKLTEFGDNLLLGAGTGATGTFISLAGFITVQDTLGGAITETFGFTGTFDPTNFFSLPGDFGTSLWKGTVEIDIVQALIDAGYTGDQTKATQVVLSLDNDLSAFSEAGTSAKVQKKVVDGPAVIVEIVPEPGTAALFGLGLFGLTVFGRRSRD